jgi:hypothetical protein
VPDEQARHAPVAHDQIGAEPDHDDGHIGGNRAEEISEICLVLRHDQHLLAADDDSYLFYSRFGDVLTVPSLTRDLAPTDRRSRTLERVGDLDDRLRPERVAHLRAGDRDLRDAVAGQLEPNVLVLAGRCPGHGHGA